MKQLLKSMIPDRVKPIAHRIFHRLFNREPRVDFSIEKYRSLSALKCSVSYNRYGGYCVPESSRDRPAAKKILSHDVWEPATIEYMISNNGIGDIVHAGTYFGDFLPALSRGCTRDSVVWAFEPNLENYRCAKITLEINDISNIILANAGLGARQEELLLKTVDENGRSLGGASQIIIDEVTVGRVGIETTRIVTVDDTVGTDRAVSIIQLDVEGHEKEALTGALKTIQRCLPILILEVWPDSNLLGSQWFSENILKLGYCKVEEIYDNSVFRYGKQEEDIRRTTDSQR